MRAKSFAPYVRDDIRVSKRLTVNVGLGWDILVPFTECNDLIIYNDPKAPLHALAKSWAHQVRQLHGIFRETTAPPSTGSTFSPEWASVTFSDFSSDGQSINNMPIDNLTLVTASVSAPETSSLLLLGTELLLGLTMLASRSKCHAPPTTF